MSVPASWADSFFASWEPWLAQEENGVMSRWKEMMSQKKMLEPAKAALRQATAAASSGFDPFESMERIGRKAWDVMFAFSTALWATRWAMTPAVRRADQARR